MKRTLNVSPRKVDKNKTLKRTKKPRKPIMIIADNEFMFIERRIVTGLIISTEYIKRVREILQQRSHIGSKTAKLIVNWCFEYFDQYGKAPGLHIQDIFDTKAKALRAEDVEDISDILASLSADFEREDEFNAEYLFDQTMEYFRKCQLKNLKDELSVVEPEEAEQLIADFKPLAIVSSYDKISKFILTIEQLHELDIEKPRLLLAPWLREGQVTFIYGHYGTGKSLLAINIAMLLALNLDNAAEWDIGEWQVKNPTGCLYVDGEMGAVELRERIDQFTYLGEPQYKMLGFPLPEYQLATEHDFVLAERGNQLQIISWLKDNPDYKLLILDSVTTLFGLTDENSNAEWNIKVNPLLRDLKALGVATIILHHSGKDEKRGLRGASAMGAMAHNIFGLTNHGSKNVDEGEAYFTLKKHKQRSGGFQFKSFDIHYSQNHHQTQTIWETEIGTQTTEDFDETQQQILKLLAGRSSQKNIAEKVNCSASWVTQVKNKARELGYLTKEGEPTKLYWEHIYPEENEEESQMGNH